MLQLLNTKMLFIFSVYVLCPFSVCHPLDGSCEFDGNRGISLAALQEEW